MAKVRGKLKQDVRLNHEGKADGGGRLHLRGEMAAVDESIKNLVDTRAKPGNKPRRVFTDKQAGPAQMRQVHQRLDELEKRNEALAAANEALEAKVAELEAAQDDGSDGEAAQDDGSDGENEPS